MVIEKNMKSKKIIEKIDSLGKKEKILLDQNKNLNLHNQNFVDAQKLKLPKSYIELSKKYGSFSFEKWIIIKAIDTIPISENGYVSVDCFYAVEDAIKLFNKYEQQLPSNMIPFSDGEPGDLICISLEKENYGKIYYWHHESPNYQNMYLLANDLEEFILKLEIFKEDNTEERTGKITKVKLSDDFLNMLKKDGFEPK
jgi:SMI1-KNR4 cell-wall